MKNSDKSKDELLIETERLKAKLKDLELFEIKNKELKNKLKERNKELEFFYSISRLLEKENLVLEDFLQEIANIIPDYWQYPDITGVMISINDKEYFNKNFKKCDDLSPQQQKDIIVYGKIAGFIRVSYFKNIFKDEALLFLDEEYKLLSAIAERLGRVIEKNNAEIKLRKNEENFRVISENSKDIICIHQKNAKYIYVSPSCKNILGYQAEELIGKNPWELVHPDDLKILEKNHEKNLKGESKLVSYRIRKKTGEYIYFETINQIIKDDEGNILRSVSYSRDVTERKKTEKILFETERRFEAFMNYIPASIYIKDSKGCYLFSNTFNNEAHNFIKWEGKTVYDFFPKKIADVFSKQDEEVLKEGNIKTEGIIEDKNGKSFYYKNHQFVIEQSDGKKLIGGISLDVTQEKNAELELKKQNLRYSTLLENINGMVYRCKNDENWTMEFVSNGCFELTGYKYDELIKNNKISYNDIILPKYQNHLYSQWQEKLLNHEAVEEEYEIKTASGKIKWVWERGLGIFDNNGQLLHLEGFITDITRRKRAAQIQKVIYDISNAGGITDNLDEFIGLIQNELGSIIDTKNFYVALYDYKTDTISLPFFADEKDEINSFPAGKTLTYYVIKTKKSLLATFEKMSQMEKLGEIETFGVDSEIWLGVPLKVEGKVTGVLAVQSYDDKNAYNKSDMYMLEFVSEQISISIERKKAEEKLKEKNSELLIAKDQAEESDRLKSAFLANMSHEIRTPMNGILGFADLLKAPDLTSDEQERYVEIIDKSGLRMLNIINDLIDISKVEAGQMEVVNSETNINQQCDYLYIFFKPEVEAKGMQLFLKKILPDEKVIINIDKEKVYAILTNLIKNAIKYSKKGHIEFGYNRKANYLEFFIKDTGIGIAKEKQKAVFERFIQADLTLSKGFEGAGLGLSITKAYVEMLGGEIWLESVEGKGSQFYFTIPYNPITIQ